MAAGGQEIPIVCILILPALFAAGMMTMDSSDQIMMLGAYRWAFLKPVRKLYYNLTITFISVVIAFVVGGSRRLARLEGARSRGRLLGLHLRDRLGVLGLVIVLIFILSWVGSTLLYRWKGYDKLDRAPASPPSPPA